MSSSTGPMSSSCYHTKQWTGLLAVLQQHSESELLHLPDEFCQSGRPAFYSFLHRHGYCPMKHFPRSNDPAIPTLAAIFISGMFELFPADCPPASSGFIAWWPMDGFALDVAGTNNGTLESDTAYTNCEVAQTFDFEDLNSHVEIPHSTMLNPTSDITVLAWIRRSVPLSQQMAWARIVDKDHLVADETNCGQI